MRKFFSFKHMDLTLEPLEGELQMKEEDWENAMSYHQMRLPIEKIDKEYERYLREKLNSDHQSIQTHVTEEDELGQVVELYNQAWLTSNTPFKTLDLETLLRLYSERHYTFLLAKLGAEYCGFAILDFEGDNNEYGFIVGMGISPNFQRKGIGTALGVAVWEFFKEHDVKEMRCEVYVNNKKSYKFIASLGFEEYDMKTYYK